MPEYDLVVRNGTLHDGQGSDARRTDIAVRAGRIVATGAVPGRGTEEIDASGLIVTPGFVDVHTHYDGQATWETRLSPSSQHGVTTVVMGNCGVGFAPCRADQRDMLIALMEGVEDIPEVVMTAGLPWNWETFPDYLDALAQRRLDIDCAAQLPHSALRVFAMGKRGAAREPATPDDLARMRNLTAEAVRAGALGVSTSRNMLHRTKKGELAPSLTAHETELAALASGLRDAGAGVFQMIPDLDADLRDEFALMRRLAEVAGRPLSFTLLQTSADQDDLWRATLGLLDDANRQGIEMRAQVFPRPVGVLYGLDLSFHPFSLHPSFRPLEHLPLAQKVRALKDPGLRARLLSEQPSDPNEVALRTVAGFRFAYEMGDPPSYEPDLHDRIDRRAERLGISPEEFAYDLLLQDEGRTILFLPGANYRDGNLKAADEMAAHPRTILGLGDGGAHYGLICDASFPTSVLSKAARSKDVDAALAKAVRALSREPAEAVGLRDRGIVAAGYKADLNIIDPGRLHLHRPSVVRDLPSGGRRLRQRADGYEATIVSGEVTYRSGAPTDALPGRLVRGGA